MTFTIGNAKSNIDSHSLTSSTSHLNTYRRLTIEAKLYYLRDTNTPEEFDYVVEAELRRGEAREFGLPAKELFRRMKSRTRNAFKKSFGKRDAAPPTIYERLLLDKSVTVVLKKKKNNNNNNDNNNNNKKAVPKPTWENSAQGVAAALLAY